MLGPGSVEALVARGRAATGRGEPPHRFVHFAHSLELGAELAELIGARLVAHGVPKRKVIVAIAPEWVSSKILPIPQMGPRDLETVIARRCAQLVESEPETIAFSGIALDAPDAAERRWLVHVVRREATLAFQAEMRRQGYPVDVLVPARTARFLSDTCLGAGAADAAEPAADPSSPDFVGARLCLFFERDACCLGLISGRMLAQLSILPGGLNTHLTDVQAGRSLVQELRGMDAFWRRTSRGERVTDVIIGGVESFVIDRLAPAIRAALGEVRVGALGDARDHVARAESDGPLPVDSLGAVGSQLDDGLGPSGAAMLDDATHRARVAVLTSLHSSRVRSIDLSVELAPRPRYLVGTALVSLAIFGSLAIRIRGELGASAASIASRVSMTHEATVDLESLRDLRREAGDVEREILDACQELETATAVGILADRLTADVLDCFGPDEAVLSISALSAIVGGGSEVGGAVTGGGVLMVNGPVIDDPGGTTLELSDLRARLAAIDGVDSVEIDMPSLGDRADDMLSSKRPSLRFHATLRLASSAPSSRTAAARQEDLR